MKAELVIPTDDKSLNEIIQNHSTYCTRWAPPSNFFTTLIIIWEQSKEIGLFLTFVIFIFHSCILFLHVWKDPCSEAVSLMTLFFLIHLLASKLLYNIILFFLHFISPNCIALSMTVLTGSVELNFTSRKLYNLPLKECVSLIMTNLQSYSYFFSS